MVPGSEEPYAFYETMDKWADAFLTMFDKIAANKKMDAGTKLLKDGLTLRNATPRPFTNLLGTMKAYIRFFLVAWAVLELWSVKKQKSSRASRRYTLQSVRVNPTLHG
jgi:hypothetical protein